MEKGKDSSLIRFYIYTSLGFFLLYSFGEFFEFRDTILRRVINSAFLVSYVSFINYFLFERVFPLFKRPGRKIFQGIFGLIVLIGLYSFGLYLYRLLLIKFHLYINYTPELPFLRGVFVHSQFSIAYIIYFSIVRNIYNNIKLREKNNQLNIEKKEAELNYLKAQTNPHFLFNTLNNIYSLARDKSDLAPESILRLSKILRFMLYETGGDFIAIEEEIRIMNDYIALERLRYDDSLQIRFDMQVEDQKLQLPPLLMIPLVENAFKHGVSETRNQPFVEIKLRVQNGHLLFVVRNSVERMAERGEVKENIGLSNLRKQLALLYTDYELTVHPEEEVFTSTLQINLASNVWH